jgi:cystathionine beta-lyase
MTDDRKWRPATQAGHLGRHSPQFMGAVNTPVFRATTMLFPTIAQLEQAMRGEFEGISYGLHGLPTVTDLQEAVATIEGGHCAFAVPSGLTATTLRFWHSPAPATMCSSPIRSTGRRDASATPPTRCGVEVSYYDPLAGAAIERDFREHDSSSPNRRDH